MHQQVNLYLPIFRQERKVFSLATVAALLGISAVALLIILLVGTHSVDRLAAAVADLKQQQAAQQRMAEAASAALAGHTDLAELQASVRKLSAQLAERTQALELLRSGAAGEPRGFAPRLRALARHQVPGVWLEELILSGQDDGLVLRGRCHDADLLPKYLQQLTGEPELVGARFDEVVLDRRRHHDPPSQARIDDEEDSTTVRFSVSSNRAFRLAGEQGT